MSRCTFAACKPALHSTSGSQNLPVIDRHSDAPSTGMEVVWLNDRPASDQSGFVLVLQEGTLHSIPGASRNHR